MFYYSIYFLTLKNTCLLLHSFSRSEMQAELSWVLGLKLSPRLQSRWQGGLWASQGSKGEGYVFKFTWLVLGLNSSWLLEWGPHFLLSIATWTTPTRQLALWKCVSWEGNRESASKTGVTIFCNLVSEVTSHHFWILLFFKSFYLNSSC